MGSTANVAISHLADRQVAIYWLHDAERFDELADAASDIFAALGHAENAAKAAGRRVSDAYRLSDQAEIARQDSRTPDELACYRNAAEILRKAGSVLGLPAGVALAQANWWHDFRHRKKLAVARHLVMQHSHHISMSGLLLLPSIVTTMLRIGRAHNHRDRAAAVAVAERYWSLMLRAYAGRPIPYLG
jgi:hypothetical protein